MKIRYFAWMREHIGTNQEVIALPDGISDIASLVAHLKSLSEGHALALSNMEVVRVAVNQTYTNLDAEISDHDEVAFFPPVTGG